MDILTIVVAVIGTASLAYQAHQNKKKLKPIKIKAK